MRFLHRFLIFALILFLFGTFTGCKAQTKNAADTALGFLSLLEAHEYDKAYDLLSTGAREATSRDEFVNKYSAIFGELGLTGIDVLSTFSQRDAAVCDGGLQRLLYDDFLRPA